MVFPAVHPIIKLGHKMDCLNLGPWRSKCGSYIAALSILVTAPLGSWAIPTFAPKLLRKGEVDPTKVAIARRIVLLAAVDTSPLAVDVLLKVAELARRCDGEAIVLHVIQSEDAESIAQLQQQTRQLLADIRYREEIVSVVQQYQVAAPQAVLEKSLIPVVVVEKIRTYAKALFI